MKKTTAVIFVGLLGLGMLSCEDDGPGVGGLDGVRVIDQRDNSCDGFNICSRTFRVAFQDQSGYGQSHWYWGEIDGMANASTGLSRPTLIFNTTGTECTLTVSANYFDFKYQDAACQVYVASADAADDAFKRNATRGRGVADSVLSVPSFSGNCAEDCCTDSTLHLGWYYASGKRRDDADGGIIEAKARIMIRHGDLCSEGTSRDPAHQVGFVDISMATVSEGNVLWAQTGFIRRRLPGGSTVFWGRYAEVNVPGTRYFAFDPEGNAFPGTERTYRLKLDYETGLWHFFDNEIEWGDWDPIDEWRMTVGNTVQYTGEVYGRETDMPGVDNHRCVMDNCVSRSRFDVVWKSADFLQAGSEVGSSDLAEWGVTPVSNEKIEIWDKKPR